MAKLKIKNRFGQTPNELLNSKEASLKAKGLYGYIQSKPEDWSFSAKRISSEIKEGVDAINNTLNELESLGYLERIKYQNDKGHWLIEYHLHLTPITLEREIPVTENPMQGNPVQGKPLNIENNSIQNNSIQINKKKLSEIKISDVEENQIYYFKVAKAFQELFIKNCLENEAPISNQENATFGNYVNPIRLMIEKDGVQENQIQKVFKYLDSPEGDFWKSNILSTKKLRKQFPQLIIKANQNNKQNEKSNERKFGRQTEADIRANLSGWEGL